MVLPDSTPERGDPTPDAGMVQPDRDRLDTLNEEINALVAGRGDRSPADLVPDVEAVMHRNGVSPPGRDGILQWIDDAMAATSTPPGPQAVDPGTAHPEAGDRGAARPGAGDPGAGTGGPR